MINCVKGHFKVYINSTCILTIVTGLYYSTDDINQSLISWQFVSKSILLLEKKIVNIKLCFSLLPNDWFKQNFFKRSRIWSYEIGLVGRMMSPKYFLDDGLLHPVWVSFRMSSCFACTIN